MEEVMRFTRFHFKCGITSLEIAKLETISNNRTFFGIRNAIKV